MLKKLCTYRALNSYACIFSIAIVSFAIYTQFYQGQEPCPLCMMQRIVFVVLALLFMLGIVIVPRMRIRRVYQGFILLVTLFGLVLAVRQVYLQHLPANSETSCSPSFNFIIQNFPLHEAARLLLAGSSDCAAITWHLWGLTMPEWSLLCFLVLALVSMIQIIRC